MIVKNTLNNVDSLNLLIISKLITQSLTQLFTKTGSIV